MNILNKISYDDESYRYEYVIFSDTLRKLGIPQYLDNSIDYGFLTFADTKEDFEKQLDIYYKDKEMKIQYIDDNNVEDNVSFSEAERVTEEYKQVDLGKSRKDTLQKPLIGLFEDDHEIRKKHIPTVLIHDSKYDTHEIEEEAIILNGAENRLAAGGGLRALRYLKK